MTLFRPTRPRTRTRPAPLPTAGTALAAAGAGRWQLADGALQLDAAARRLLGARSARLSLASWLARLPAAESAELAATLAGEAATLAFLLQGPAGPVWLHGGRHGPGWVGLVVQGPLQHLSAASPSPQDTFFASVSHELRTPLNAVLGFTRLAQSGEATPSTRRQLGHIEQSATLMLRVVNDLLDLASLDAGKLEIEPDQPLDPDALVLRVGTAAAALRLDRPIRVYTTVDPACPRLLRGDAGRIEQVLLNLMANALKFTPRGRVVLAVKLRAQQADRVTLRLSVSDTGVGIATEALPRLGLAFERARDAALHRASGSGLGLAVVQRLLQLHGTRLQVASVPGGGTTCWFDLVLPVDTTAGATAPVADTVLHTTDRHLAATVATQWRAHGQALLPAAAASRARRWVVDVAAADATARMAQALHEGRELVPVSADPDTGLPGVHTLLLLPAAVFEATPPRPDPKQPQLDGLRVLLVEDNPLNQRVLVEFLAEQGARAVVASEGRAAPELLARAHVDVVLLDLELPDQSGLDTARTLRQMHGGEQLPLIFLSAHLDAADRMAATALGALACLHKPFEPATLLALLAAIAQALPDSQRTTLPSPAATSLRALFAEQWPQQRAAIEAAPDHHALRRAVHALRGSLAFVGDAQAQRLARQVEEGLRAGQPPPAQLLADLLRHTDTLSGAAAPAQSGD